MRLLLFTLLIGFCSFAAAGTLIEGVPSSWKVTVEVGCRYRITCHSVGRLYVESRFLYPANKDYTLTMFADKIPDAEARLIYDRVLKTLQNFHFSEEGSGVMDDNILSFKLEVGLSTLEGTSYPASQAPEEIQRILEYCEKLSAVKWTWTNNLPHQITTDVSPRNRNVKFVREMFKNASSPLPVKQVLEELGCPDGFSTHFGASREQCVACPGVKGGTMRFILEDGIELHIWTPDFAEVHFAVRYGPKAKEEECIFSMPERRL